MTAAYVGAREVLAVEDVPSRWVDKDTGTPRVYRTIVRLLLDDGSEVYGCTKCTYTAEKVTSVASHQRAHGPRDTSTVVAPTRKKPGPAAGTPKITQRPGAGTPADRTIQGRPTPGDRQRAVKAEAALYRIRDLIDEVLPR
ncbi:hypothetical protein [Pseudonocardia sp. D17]|uniref:hypothetical protein n=1 Tax=Pseudonocardia sp. D17 TaxID=882661 RepID=UPI002B37BAF1|nr:hypothetical protein PSD17_56710 [Pseudonocardia sp. D17]